MKIPVINGDGTDIDCLCEIVDKANVFIAVTGQDGNNSIFLLDKAIESAKLRGPTLPKNIVNASNN